MSQMICPTSPSITCPKCEHTYSTINPPKQLINCAHILCLNCIHTQILCPQDLKRIERRKYRVEAFITNQELLALVLSQKDPLSLSSHSLHQSPSQTDIQENLPQEQSHVLKETSFNCQPSLDIDKKAQPLDTKLPAESITQSQNIAQNQSISQSSSITQQQANKEEVLQFQTCLLHNKKADLICLQDKCFICPNCGLFGQHKPHTLLPYDSFVIQFGSLAQQCLKIREELAERKGKLSTKLFERRVEAEIELKRQKQSKKISQFINYLIDQVKGYQQNLLDQLEATLASKEQQLHQMIDLEELQQKVNQFNSNVDILNGGLIGILKMESIEQFIDYIDENNPKNYMVKEGEYLIMQIDNYHKTCLSHIVKELNSFHFTFDRKKQLFKYCAKLHQPNSQAKAQGIPTFRQDHQPSTNQFQNEPKCETAKYHYDQMLISVKPESQQQHIHNRHQHNLNPIFAGSTPDDHQNFNFTQGFKGMTDRALTDLETYSQMLLPEPQHSPIKSRSTLTHFNRPTLLNIKPEDKIQVESQCVKRSNTNSKTKSINSSNHTEKELLNMLTQKRQGRNKKQTIKLPQKYMKIYEELQKDNLDVLDLGGAFLGDTLILKIAELVPTRTRLKSVKLMNNKITDEIFPQLIVLCKSIGSLNLSYNNLTQRVLDHLESQVEHLGYLSNITLSNNKIILRHVKDRLQNLRKQGIKVSL